MSNRSFHLFGTYPERVTASRHDASTRHTSRALFDHVPRPLSLQYLARTYEYWLRDLVMVRDAEDGDECDCSKCSPMTPRPRFPARTIRAHRLRDRVPQSFPGRSLSPSRDISALPPAKRHRRDSPEASTSTSMPSRNEFAAQNARAWAEILGGSGSDGSDEEEKDAGTQCQCLVSKLNCCISSKHYRVHPSRRTRPR